VTSFEQITQSFRNLSHETMTGEDLEGIEETLNNTLCELKRLQSVQQGACSEHSGLAQSARELEAKLKEAVLKRCEAYISACNELADNPVADTQSLAMQLLPIERTMELLQDSLDLLNYVRLPLALDKKLESTRDLRRVEHLEAALYVARTHCTMLQKLERAGLSEHHGRVIAFSEVEEKLKLAATEAHRQAQLADAELTAARAARIARTAQRHADSLATRAEAMYSALELSRMNTPESKAK
jgi:hypothetical protein